VWNVAYILVPASGATRYHFSSTYSQRGGKTTELKALFHYERVENYPERDIQFRHPMHIKYKRNYTVIALQ